MTNQKFPSNEYELIERIQKCLSVSCQQENSYEEMIGDDAAIRLNRTAGERLIITADISVEDVHFSLKTMSLEEAAYRAMVSNLSDCAAMGAKPDSALVQLVFPKNCADIGASVENVYKGFGRACDKWKFPIVGGDLSGGGKWTIAVTLIGSADPQERVLKRSGICDGDVLWVTGTPGESAAGLAALLQWGREKGSEKYPQFVNAHITPVPRIDEGRALAACQDVHAMMDLSDGLSKDIATLCFDNKLGFIFENPAEKYGYEEMITLSKELNCDWKNWFFHGGEEYELLFACDPSFHPYALDKLSNVKLLRLGSFTSKLSGVRVRQGDDAVELESRGWDHVKSIETP
ncbi:MAG: thiamine-phosphate kinase [Chitinispirillia bacterium]|nr:thiamine-phosphate kinase [Chitinispirillia bacterium]